MVHTYNVPYGKRIKILHGCPFEGWPNRAWPIQPISRFLPKRVGWPCPVRSALKRTPVQDFNSFSIRYIISTTYQKIGDLFCSDYNSGLSHSVFFLIYQGKNFYQKHFYVKIFTYDFLKEVQIKSIKFNKMSHEIAKNSVLKKVLALLCLSPLILLKKWNMKSYSIPHP